MTQIMMSHPGDRADYLRRCIGRTKPVGPLGLQAIGVVCIFVDQVAGGAIAPGPTVAVLLVALILVAGSAAMTSIAPRIALVVAKAGLAIVTGPATWLSLLVIPAIVFETVGFAEPWITIRRLWILAGCALAVASLAVPGEIVVPFVASIAVAGLVTLIEQRYLESRRILADRARRLEADLASSEAIRVFLERAGVNDRSLATLEERGRIAQRLHDSLGHAMTGSIMQLEAAQQIMEVDPERAARAIQNVREALKAGLADVRLHLRVVRPDSGELGRQRLQSMLDAFTSDHGVGTDLRASGDPGAVSPSLWRAVEENLREALTNVLQHSSARRFECSVQVLNGVHRIEFRDDGNPTPPARRGMGLDGMEARTRAEGGTLVVDWSRGFSVVMIVPRRGTNGDTAAHR